MATDTHVSDDLFLRYYGSSAGCALCNSYGELIMIDISELPDLLRALQAAAVGMGVSTGPEDALALSKAIIERYALYDGAHWTCRYCSMWAEDLGTLVHRDDCEVLMAKQALAKAER